MTHKRGNALVARLGSGFGRHPVRTPRSAAPSHAEPSHAQPSHRERGAVLAEFALIAPMLFILLFGIFEIGMAMNQAQAVEAAAREGARVASLGSSNLSDVQLRVNDALTGIPLDNPVNVSMPTGTCAGRQGQTVRVLVTTDHDIDIPLLPSATVTLNSEATFRCEA